MCFDSDSEPPIPRIAGAAVSHDDLTLTSADGTELAAFLATPDGDATTGVVILPDVRGLYHFYEELALRFAERGYAAIAIDYFGRTAGIEKRENDWDYMPHVQQTTPAGVQADVRAAVEDLRSRGCDAIFTVGFCFGGSNSWHQAANGHGLAGAIGFYGRPVGPTRDGSPAPIERVNDYTAPLLGLFGGADQGIPQSAVDEFDQALTKAGKPHEFKTYEGAPHSFFDRRFAEHQEACADAWERILGFIKKYSPAS